MHLLKSPLGDLLSAVSSGEITQRQLAELGGLCHRIALTFVRKRIASGKLNPSFLGLSDGDISLDCVAELFTPSPDGVYADFTDYFDDRAVDVCRTSDHELLVHLRRLIFSACNDNIFRMYGEADPSLSRIIRNIKLGVKRSESIAITTAFDEQIVVPRPHAPDGALPPMPYEEIQRLVDEALGRCRSIPGILSHISCCFRDHTMYRKEIPLTSLACCVREGYARLNDPVPVSGGDPMFNEDIHTLVHEACAHIGRRVGSRYLVRGKLSSGTLGGYMSAIGNLIETEFTEGPDGDLRHYDFFKAALPGITREEYARTHRATFEYLAKLVRKRSLQVLRDS